MPQTTSGSWNRNAPAQAISGGHYLRGFRCADGFRRELVGIYPVERAGLGQPLAGDFQVEMEVPLLGVLVAFHAGKQGKRKVPATSDTPARMRNR